MILVCSVCLDVFYLTIFNVRNLECLPYAILLLLSFSVIRLMFLIAKQTKLLVLL